MTKDKALELARQQLAVLKQAAVLPRHCLLATLLGDDGTMLHDLNGTEILLRVPLLGEGPERGGYADIAMVPDFGTVLFSLSRSRPWDEKQIRAETAAAGLPADGRFIAYQYPCVGLEVRNDDQSSLARDWLSGEVETLAGTPIAGGRVTGYSLLESISPTLKETNGRQYRAIIDALDPLSLAKLEVSVPPVRGVVVEIKYSMCPESHVCFELRHRLISKWCVPAAVEMVLAFYRYEYSERDIACALGQETKYGANDLPPGNEYMVIESISSLTRGALQSRMYARALWDVITSEIAADRPLILFSGGHARVVAGFSELEIGAGVCQGLILYDPQDVEVCWEKFNPSCELLLFSAELQRWVPPHGLTVRHCT